MEISRCKYPPPSDGKMLSINYLGYEPVEVLIGKQTNIKITLKESSIGVDEIVVTALGIKRSEKALSYNVQKVSSDH